MALAGELFRRHRPGARGPPPPRRAAVPPRWVGIRPAWPLRTRPSLRSSIVSPGSPTTRLTSRWPSCGEKKTTMSPRLRVAPLGEVAGRERHLEVVSQLVHEHAVAFENRRLHRAGGHVAPISQRGAEREDDQPDDQPPADFLAPPIARPGAESRSVHEGLTQSRAVRSTRPGTACPPRYHARVPPGCRRSLAVVPSLANEGTDGEPPARLRGHYRPIRGRARGGIATRWSVGRPRRGGGWEANADASTRRLYQPLANAPGARRSLTYRLKSYSPSVAMYPSCVSPRIRSLASRPGWPRQAGW